MATYMRHMDDVRKELNIKFDLKSEQYEAISELCSGKNVFCVLPTGFGKSEIFVFPPLLKKKEHPDQSFIALIIMPLRALMKDQVKRWSQRKVRCAALLKKKEMSLSDTEDILQGKIPVLFTSPESIFIEPWQSMLKEHRKKFCVVALDEVHCMTDWGESFRPQYQNVGKLRAILCGVPVLAVTATITAAMQHTVITKMHMASDDFTHIAVVPDRPNINLELKRPETSPSINTALDWYIQHLRCQGSQAPKVVIFARSIDIVMDIFGVFAEELGDALYAEEGILIEVFHGHVDPLAEEEVPESFMSEEGCPRCVITTLAFGMGINITDIDYVVHWGPPSNALLYWQEVGRCARDGRQGKAIMYLPSRSVNKTFVSEDMLNVVKSSQDQCIRKLVLKHLQVHGIDDHDIDRCCGGENCCSNCNN